MAMDLIPCLVRRGFMHCLVALLISATLRPAPVEASFNGVWVLNQRLSRFASPAKPDRVMMEVNSTASGWVCVLGIRTDARGQHRQSDQYSSPPTDVRPPMSAHRSGAIGREDRNQESSAVP